MKIRHQLITLLLLFTTIFVHAEKPWDHGNLKVSSDKRYIQHEDGTTFHWMGDTAWYIRKLNPEEAAKYFTNRKNKHYSVIQVTLAQSTVPDYSSNETLPFESGDFSKPNNIYWNHVDQMIKLAGSYGLYIGMLPCWGSELNDENIARGYATFLAQRYKNYKNIIWMIGGDDRYTKNKTSIYNAMGNTIKEIDKNHLITFHPTAREFSLEAANLFKNEQWQDFRMLQTGHGKYNTNELYPDTYLEIFRKVYNMEPTKPVLDGEPGYEDIYIGLDGSRASQNTNVTITASYVREMAYREFFSGAFGHTYGNLSIFQMSKEYGNKFDKYGPAKPWDEALDTEGSTEMSYFTQLMKSKPLAGRVPDQKLIQQGKGTAIRGEKYAFIYIKSSHRITINMGKIKGDAVSALWFNPRTGTYSKIDTYSNEGTAEFTLPDTKDWVLVLESIGDTPPESGIAKFTSPANHTQLTSSSMTVKWDGNHGKYVTIRVRNVSKNKKTLFTKVINDKDRSITITGLPTNGDQLDLLLITYDYKTHKYIGVDVLFVKALQ